MKEEMIKNLTNDIYRRGDCLRSLWRDYVRERVEVSLGRSHITLVDGVSERMDKMVPEGDDVMLVDQFGNRFSLYADCGIETLMELHDVVLVENQPSEE